MLAGPSRRPFGACWVPEWLRAPDGTAEFFSRRLGLIVRICVSPWCVSTDDVSVDADEGGSSVSAGIERVVTMWVTDLEKNFSSRYVTISMIRRDE